MSAPDEPFTIGVEEEFLIVDADTLELRPRAERILPSARGRLGEQVQPELNLSQLEIETHICQGLDELRGELRRLRREVSAAAEAQDSRILASGTHPFSQWLGQQITPKDRYLEMDASYQQLAWEQLVCGCHVHVSVQDKEMVIAVMDRLRPWLAVLLALGGNSPYWQGVDTGYASYRTQLFDRWPTTGTPLVMGDRATYERVVDALVATDSIIDATRIYWDVRPSVRFPTLEFRVADVCLDADQAVMIAGLARSLVRTAYEQGRRGEPMDHARPELLRAARWRAARYGIEGTLIDVEECRSVPAAQRVGRLLDFVRPDLEAHGEWDDIHALVQQTLQRGTGARRQREILARTGEFRDLVAALVEELNV